MQSSGPADSAQQHAGSEFVGFCCCHQQQLLLCTQPAACALLQLLRTLACSHERTFTAAPWRLGPRELLDSRRGTTIHYSFRRGQKEPEKDVEDALG
jgi:hypothetical protein